MTGFDAPRSRIAIVVFLVSMFVFNMNLRRIGTFDSMAASLIPLNLLEGRGLVLDQSVSAFPPPFDTLLVRSPTGHIVSFYPVVTPILAVPFYIPWAAARLFHRGADIGTLAPVFEKLAASSIAAFSVLFVFLVLDRFTKRRNALLLTAAYAFGTSTWMIASQSLWQHGAAELLIAGSLLLLFADGKGPARLIALGLAAGLITANRPGDIVFSAAIAIIVILRYRFRAAPFFLASGLVAALWIAYNEIFFHSLLGGYGLWRGSHGEALWMAASGWTGFAGLLFSNRGLLVYSPFLLLLLRAPREAVRRIPGLGILLLAFLGFLFVSARTPDWAGGYCYGPRFSTDALPVLTLALVGPVERLRSSIGKSFLGLALLVAFANQAVGAFCFPGGGSGNEQGGLWNLSNFSPYVEWRAGLRSPDFADLFLPKICLRDRLPDDGIAASYRWISPPKAEWRAGQTLRLQVGVRNDSSVLWTSLGARMGIGAVRLAGYWTGRPDGPAYTWPLGDWWLSTWMPPGRSVERSISITAPNVAGPLQLCLELVQTGYGLFSERGRRPLCVDVTAADGPVRKGKRFAVEWTGGSGPQTLPSGSEGLYRVGARNIGERPWSSAFVAYHWVQFDGHNGNYEGVRTPMPGSVEPGKPVWVDARVIADIPPGTYGLQFDLVNDVAWASNEGSPPMMVLVRVVGSNERTPSRQ